MKKQESSKNTQTREKVLAYARKAWVVLQNIWQWVYKLRSVVLAIPVIVGAVILAQENMEKLPALVGINMQASGEYAMMIERNVAVGVPLLVTAACLLMMFISRRVLYPWLISLFSLVLPLLLWLTNVVPG